MTARRRSWLYRERSVEECEQTLRSLDDHQRARRAERLSMEGHSTFPIGYRIPNRTWHLLDEAGECFTNGQYNACVLTLATGVEHGLRRLCEAKGKTFLGGLITKSLRDGIVNESEEKLLRGLNKYRNDLAHSNMGELAAGITLQDEQGSLTLYGATDASSLEELGLADEREKEIAIDLASELYVGQLFIQVRVAVYDIFDRHSQQAGEIEPIIE